MPKHEPEVEGRKPNTDPQTEQVKAPTEPNLADLLSGVFGKNQVFILGDNEKYRELQAELVAATMWANASTEEDKHNIGHLYHVWRWTFEEWKGRVTGKDGKTMIGECSKEELVELLFLSHKALATQVFGVQSKHADDV